MFLPLRFTLAADRPELYAAGVDYEDVVATLERVGIDKFVASFTELFQGIADKRQQPAVAALPSG